MKVTDIVSWIPAHEMGLKQLEQIFVNYKNGLSDDNYIVSLEVRDNAANYILDCKDELVKEGKNVAGIFRDDMIVALIGYKE